MLAARAEHQRSVAEGQLCVRNGAVLAGHDQMAFEAEGIAEPVDGFGGVRVAQAWDQVDDRALGLGQSIFSPFWFRGDYAGRSAGRADTPLTSASS